jgi:hypothetical protein
MSYTLIATLIGVAALNVVALWILFFGGAEWLEGTGLFVWQIRRQWRADAPTISSGVFKAGAWVVIAFELGAAVLAMLAS